MENGNGHNKTFAFSDFDLETELQTLRRGSAEIHLAKRPFRVLLFLIENRERVVSRHELLEKFLGMVRTFMTTRYGNASARFARRLMMKINQRALSKLVAAAVIVYRFDQEASENGKKSDVNTNGDEHPAESEVADEQADKNGGKQTISENRNETFNLANRSILVVGFAVGLVSFVVLAFFTYRPPSKNVEAKNLVETIRAKRSIAILPLKNLTGDAANDYLSDGVTESLINEVSRIESLKVISRSSAFQFKDKNVSAQEIGERLGVETILEGGLKQSGEKVRVEVRLVNTKDGSVIWASDSDQKKLADIFAIQDNIACQIVTELKVKLCGEVMPPENYTKNVKAYQLYLRGLYYRNQLGAEDLKRAVDFYNQALQVDPNYALAHEGLASVYAVMELNSMIPPGTVAPKAEFHANRALELDDNLAGAYLALGAVKTMRNYDLAERERYYKQWLLKNPNHRTAHLWLSNIYTARGEFEQAEAEALLAQEIDPLSYGVHLTLADIYFYWRKPDKIIEQAELMLTAKPDDEQALVYMILANVQKGDMEKALAELEKIPSNDGMRICVLIAVGHADEARKVVEAVAKSDAAKNNPYNIAENYAAIGDKDAAFAWLEKSYQMRQANLISIKIDPAFDNLRDDARYQDLLRRVHLTN